MTASEEPVWSVVMFDLPVKTKPQRRASSDFRHLLLDNGFQMAQLSVYVRFSPSVHSLLPTLRTIKHCIPPGGEVRILTVTDREWATALRYVNSVEETQEEEPEQLTIF
ncbi:MAG: CRISPR-associated endonuclease Cas2 [Propionibacteriaceae bacterium]|jgi:CRISPR-associated protein Cas2|nr:CRISPR-associated endonuclease Cas2 [Propionibacteriaceae bacterium]